ncbi:calcium uptake protein 1-like isoform X2 [Leptotrombidium deliense]|uniref:Calcium uptake protein 1-like isoform X2 n=1 Tax=Leptotrombidium deliense TaxID=299467 RepID=A0A443SMF0_9ACAR|nr:calcium uptake protein 1-like isoform X2 [Leptotrombidium deliense]
MYLKRLNFFRNNGLLLKSSLIQSAFIQPHLKLATIAFIDKRRILLNCHSQAFNNRYANSLLNGNFSKCNLSFNHWQSNSQSRSFHRKQYAFSHQKVAEPREKQVFTFLVCLAFPVLFIDTGYYWRKTKRFFNKKWNDWFKVEAAAVDSDQMESRFEEVKEEKKEKKEKNSFRDKKIVEYENRIRSFSTPDKIFRYFATVKVVYDDNESEIFMTPDDFLRAVTPGLKQPDGLGLDQFKRVDLSKSFSQEKMDCGLKKDSIFYKLSNYGLINFSDFLFLLTVISVSHRHFKIAFRMFDLNGDGNVDYEEFERVQNAILHQTSVGQKLGSASSKTNYRGVSSALAKYFFGNNLKQKLTIEKFLDFQKEMQTEMLTLEFERKRKKNEEKIKETDFSELLIAYAGFPDKKKKRMVNRVRKMFPDTTVVESPERGITMKDYLDFHYFLQNINDVDIALTFYNIAGASIDEATLKHAAKTVANIDLRDHVIKVVFTLFDENLDGQLSNREFISVMKERLRRGLNRPKDTGFLKLANAVWNSLKMDLF